MLTQKPHHFCHSCGLPYEARYLGTDELSCNSCGYTAYINPSPVAILLIPTPDEDGLYLVRRGIPPGVGALALPGGFVKPHESWQQAAVRETEEELQIHVHAASVATFMTESIPSGAHVLCFGSIPHCAPLRVDTFVASREAQERVVVTRQTWPTLKRQIIFPLHIIAIERYFASTA